MKARRALGYFLREAASDLWKRRAINLVSVATIAGTLYVLGLFGVLMTNVARVVASWAEENRVSVYIKDACTTSERVALEEAISRNPAAVGVEYVSKDEALMRFRRDFPDLADIASGLDANPLPASFEITVRGASSDPAVIEGLAKSLETAPGVDGVRYDLVWVRRVRSILRMVGWTGALLGGVLLCASIITISGVIRLNVLARRDEIEILRLVGATRGFIRGPFLFEGAFQGTAAAIVAAGSIVATWALAGPSVREHLGPMLSGLASGVIPLWTPPALLAVGLAVGLAGSLLSLRRALSSAA